MGDGAIPAPEPAAELSEAATVLVDVVAIHDVQTKADREEEREEQGHQDNELGGSEDGGEDDRHEPNNAESPQRAGKSGIADLLGDYNIVRNMNMRHSTNYEVRIGFNLLCANNHIP